MRINKTILGLLVELLGLEFWVEHGSRRRSEPRWIRQIVESEGGEIESIRVLGGIRRSPFKGLCTYPRLYECCVR